MTHRPPRGVPRDEWLLAVGLAHHGQSIWFTRESRVADRISYELPIWSAAWNGASAVIRPEDCLDDDEGNPDAYAAGAALAMVMEAE